MADEQQHPEERHDQTHPRPPDEDEAVLPPRERTGSLQDLLDEEEPDRRGGLAGPARLWAALAGAFLLGALAAGMAGQLGGPGPGDGDRVAFAELVGMDSAVEDTEVELLDGDDGRVLRIFPVELPDVADGYAQVWVTDNPGSRLVPLGVLEEGQTDVTVPSTLNLGDYPVVEVSLEPYDGDPGHGGRTLWRGHLDTPAT